MRIPRSPADAEQARRATLDTTTGPYDDLNQGATINNLAGDSFTITGPGGVIRDLDSSAVAFNNAGTLTCDVAVGGTFDMSAVAVANTGSVVVQQGSCIWGKRQHRRVRLVHRRRRHEPGPVRPGPDDRFGDRLRRGGGSGRLHRGGELPRRGRDLPPGTPASPARWSAWAARCLDVTARCTFAGGRRAGDLDHRGADARSSGTLGGTDSFVVNGLLDARAPVRPRHQRQGRCLRRADHRGDSTLYGTTLNNDAAATWTPRPADVDLLPRRHDQQPGRCQLHALARPRGNGIRDQDNSAAAFNNAGTQTAPSTDGETVGCRLPFRQHRLRRRPAGQPVLEGNGGTRQHRARSPLPPGPIWTSMARTLPAAFGGLFQRLGGSDWLHRGRQLQRRGRHHRFRTLPSPARWSAWGVPCWLGRADR